MKKNTNRLASWVLVLTLPTALFARDKLTIVHINDTHGQIEPVKAKDGSEYGGFARVAYVADSLETEAEAEGRGFLFLHAGDVLQGPPISNMHKGKLDFELLNEMGLDVMVVGNHEFDFGQTNLSELVTEAEFPILSANVFYEHGDFLVEQYEEYGRQYLVVVGLTTPGTPFGTHPDNVKGLVFASPDTAITDLIENKKYGEKDLIVALTHLGYYEDSLLAEQVPEVDLIVGGHSHTVLEEPREVNNALIVQAGARTVYLGKLEVEVKKGRIVDWEYDLILLSDSIPEDPGMAARIAEEAKVVDEKMGQPVGKTEVALVPGFTEAKDEMSLGDLLARLMQEETGADFAFFNQGGVRSTIFPGDITMKDILTALPFANTVVTMELTAEQVEELLNFNMAHGPHSGGTLHLAGVEYDIEDSSAVNIRICGQPIEKDRTYKIATNSFLAAGGDGYEVLKQGSGIYDTGTVDYTLLISYIEKVGIIK
ncbi:5'-nucleotidase C-terminal domain-containing protein [candidate division WOR-3 bacterium]|nr:5'-nucleotidase C-terminal domain-containing protein [candidate division WOR-3 bacterium]